MNKITAPADRTTGPSAARSLRPAPILVGRGREQAFLREELAAAVSGRGRLVLLGGEAGIGKTTLARDLAREAEDSGVQVIAGHCYGLTNTAPYGPWLELFSSSQNDPRLPAPPAAFREGRLGRVTDQSAFFAEVRQFLAELAMVRPAYILLEDLHWADPASIELLRHIAPSLGRLPILLLATYRLDELTRHHALFQQLPALVREGDGARLEPRRLDADALRALVAARYRLLDADEARLVSYLERHAEGNPFFAVELLRALEEDGLLQVGDDRSTLGELARVVVPTLLRQVIDGRVARLGEETRRSLAIAAVIGQEVPLALWSALAEHDEEALLAIVERVVEAHLMEAKRNGTHVRFVHALTREAIYEAMLPPRRRLWHRRVGEALAADTGADPDAVAAHFQQAGDPRAWRWLERAGDRAQRAYAWLTASERLRAAAALLEGDEGEERKYCQLVFRFAYLLRFSDPAGSIGAFNEVERLASRAGDTVLAAEVQHIRGIHLCYADRFRAGLAEMMSGIDTLAELPLDTDRASNAIWLWFAEVRSQTTPTDQTGDALIARRAHAKGLDFRRCAHVWHWASVGEPRPAAAVAEQFVALLAGVAGASGGYRVPIAFAYHGLGIAYAVLGQPEEARQAWRRSREIFGEVEHFALIAIALLGELRDITLAYGAADPAACRQLAAEAEAALDRAGGALQPGLSSRLAWLGCLVLNGRWDEADQILRDLPAPGNAYLRREVTTTLAHLARHRGEPERAWGQVHALLPDGPATEPGDMIHQEGLFLLRLASDLCLDTGDLATAHAWLEAHDRWLAWSGSLLGCAEGQVAWARWYHAAGEPARARSLAAEALSLAAAPDQPLVRLTAHRLIGEIETAAGEYAQAEAHLTTALDLAEACEAPFERALTFLVLAETRQATEGSDAAIAFADESRGICLRLGARPAIARADALIARFMVPASIEAYPAGLTRREVEVLRLLARHQTDKEIAEALFISPHTVSTHVKHVLSKLGVASRRAAAAYAADHGLA